MNETTTEERDTLLGSTNGKASGNSEPVSQSETEPEVIDASAETEPKKRRKLPYYIVGSVLLIAAVAGAIYWTYARQFEYTDDAFVDGEITQISPKITAYVAKVWVKENQFVKKGDLLIELDAQDLEARLEQAKSQVRAGHAQRVRALAQTDLTRTTAGATQFQALSNVQTAKNKIDETGLGAETKLSEIRQAESAVKIARANLAEARSRKPQAESNLRLAQIEYDRSFSLFNHGSVSRQSLEISENALQRAKADLNAVQSQATAAESRIDEAEAKVATARNNYKLSLAQVNSSRSEVDESIGRLRDANAAPERIAVDQSAVGTADAVIAQAEAAVHSVEVELASTKIFAPGDGFVTRKNVQEGQLVQPGAALMAISQTDVWIVANFKETQLERMTIGQPVDIKVDAFPGRTFHGRIESFQAGTGSAFSVLPSENASGNFLKVVQRVPVKIVFDEKPENVHLLVPGMSVQPRVRVR